MNKTLVIFSGLPGTGKTTLADLVARTLRIPLLALDDIVVAVPGHLSRCADSFWEDKDFVPWAPGSALFVDAAHPLGQNLADVLAFVTADNVSLMPLCCNPEVL